LYAFQAPQGCNPFMILSICELGSFPSGIIYPTEQNKIMIKGIIIIINKDKNYV